MISLQEGESVRDPGKEDECPVEMINKIIPAATVYNRLFPNTQR